MRPAHKWVWYHGHMCAVSLCAVLCCSYFLSLALTPSAMIGLDANLRAPKVELLCNCKPSLYAYPPPVTTGEQGSLEPAGWGRPPLLLMHLKCY